MSDTSYNALQLSMFLGPDKYTAPQLVVRADNVGALNGHLRDLTEPDETDPEGTSPINDTLDSIQQIQGAVTVKFGITPNKSAAPISPDGGFTPGGFDSPAPQTAGKTCAHGAMTFRSGITKSGPNTGKPYKAYFCPAPRGTEQCKPVFVND